MSDMDVALLVLEDLYKTGFKPFQDYGPGSTTEDVIENIVPGIIEARNVPEDHRADVLDVVATFLRD